jgi:hypothetical protein
LQTPLPHRRHRFAPAARALLLAWLVSGASGCEDINWPFHHPQAAEPPPSADGGAGNDGNDGNAECADLLSQIRQNREARREAVTTSTNPDIVSAAQGKADKRIDDLQQRYDELDCPAEDAETNRPGRQAPLQPAPGAVNR